jgi:uncharacterized coiled-coil protein SlyX
MAVWGLIPTCNNEMSCYTLVALCIFATIGFGMLTIAYWWASNEFKFLKKSVHGHDEYIVDTAMVINKMEVKLAVQQSALGEIKEDIADMKSDIKKDIAALREDIKQLLSR